MTEKPEDYPELKMLDYLNAQGSTVNVWPHSQLCMGCDHALFIIDTDIAGCSAYACQKGIDREGETQPCEHNKDI